MQWACAEADCSVVLLYWRCDGEAVLVDDSNLFKRFHFDAVVFCASSCCRRYFSYEN